MDTCSKAFASTVNSNVWTTLELSQFKFMKMHAFSGLSYLDGASLASGAESGVFKNQIEYCHECTSVFTYVSISYLKDFLSILTLALKSLMNVIGISVTNKSQSTKSTITSHRIKSRSTVLVRMHARPHSYLAVLRKAVHEVADILGFSECARHWLCGQKTSKHNRQIAI